MAAENGLRARLAALPPLRQVARRHGIEARRALGQNFLFDLNVTRRIVRQAGIEAGAVIYEVGPGIGALTRALLETGPARLVVVEKDNRCLPALAELQQLADGRLEIIEGDALGIDEGGLFPGGGARVVANLPYNIASPLLAKWLSGDRSPAFFRSLTLMFQREVAERIVAAPGSRDYGRLSVLAQWRTDPRLLFHLSPRAFIPPPKVSSSVVDLRPAERGGGDIAARHLQAVTAAAFGQRRKMLRRALKSLWTTPEAVLTELGIDPTRRAEELDMDAFFRLARRFAADQESPGIKS